MNTDCHEGKCKCDYYCSWGTSYFYYWCIISLSFSAFPPLIFLSYLVALSVSLSLLSLGSSLLSLSRSRLVSHLSLSIFICIIFCHFCYFCLSFLLSSFLSFLSCLVSVFGSFLFCSLSSLFFTLVAQYISPQAWRHEAICENAMQASVMVPGTVVDG